MSSARGVAGTMVAATLALALAGVLLPPTRSEAGGRRGKPGPAQLAVDPGIRSGPPGAGTLIKRLTKAQQSAANTGKGQFQAAHAVTGSGETGLGPRFDSNSCASCHSQPAAGGSSPTSNPLFAVFQLNGAQNTMPDFETSTGPALTPHFLLQADGVTRDGYIHQLFVVTGRSDAAGCAIAQPDFASAEASGNLGLRQPSPAFGAGLVEMILDSDLLANLNANLTLKQSLGIGGRPNPMADGSFGRFGWKAQRRSVIAAAFEQMAVEMGVTNEFFPNELDETAGCVLNPVPEDHSNFNTGQPSAFPGDVERLSIFMRFLDQPKPSRQTGSTRNGQAQFNAIGCVLCHTQTFTTPASSITALSATKTNLFSDLLLHHMGPCLADGIVQGSAQGDEFRTAPLWGAGKRAFFLHDGRTADIVSAVELHFCAGNSQYPDSEANAVINSFNALSSTNQQDLINFLRSL